ncbi:hypothetical protein AB0B28_03460 [Glycomyces sp. NPDC046736]|uniref:hypothetical protein n=1 Tax=Glycomyces sp. NPDC046736 TaxID=3155615 RepID=UPI00340F4180
MSNTAAIATRTRRARLFAGTAALAAVAAAALSATAAEAAEPADGAACEITELPMPRDTYFSIVTGMSEDGSAIAYRAYPVGISGDERYPMVYLDGEATEVVMPGVEQLLNDVNSSGTAVGRSLVDNVDKPYVWQDGVLTELDGAGSANGINESGDIVGSVGGDEWWLPALWPAGKTEPVELPVPEGTLWGSADEIRDDGTVIGTLGIQFDEDGIDVSTPYVWHPDGTGEALPAPEGFGKEDVLYTLDLAGDWATGYVLTPEYEGGVRWNLAEGTVEVLDMVYAPGVNAEGTAAGEGYPSAVYQPAGGEVVELPGLTAPEDNWFGDMATEIDPTGKLLAGQVYAGDDEYDWHILKAVTWTCE